MELWKRLLEELRTKQKVMLLQVVESIGSSPGRAGFRMFVTEDGRLFGSIGGGSMEHKLVELAQALMLRNEVRPLVKRQIHRTDVPAERSGMICSGEQTVAFIPLSAEDAPVVVAMVDRSGRNAPVTLIMDPKGLRIAEATGPTGCQFQHTSDSEWRYEETLGRRDRILIFGGGHVGVALSRVMHQLEYQVHVIDDRPGLNTLESNNWAHRKDIIDYATVGERVQDDPELYVVLASFGYRTDEQILRQIIRKRFKYIGMLGSEEKVRKMFEGMQADGFTEAELARVHAPVGLPINSRTPDEISISIAAQIIQIRNT